MTLLRRIASGAEEGQSTEAKGGALRGRGELQPLRQIIFIRITWALDNFFQLQRIGVK
jgi:hypothetical protein